MLAFVVGVRGAVRKVWRTGECVWQGRLPVGGRAPRRLEWSCCESDYSDRLGDE